MSDNRKRKIEEPELDNDEGNNEGDDVGPSLDLAVIQPKKKVLKFETLYLKNIPSSEFYEKSYMHKDVINFVAVTKTNFILTASKDGCLKMWKKKPDQGIEFVKHFKCFREPITNMSVSLNGELCAVSSTIKFVKIFDVENFDMINMLKLDYTPQCICWIFSGKDPFPALAVAEKDSPNIHIYDGKGCDERVHTCNNHLEPVILMKYNPVFGVVVSIDKIGTVQYWAGPRNDYEFAKNVSFEFSSETDLVEYLTSNISPLNIAFSHNGKTMAIRCKDRKIRVYNFSKGKRTHVIDESIQLSADLQTNKAISNMELQKRNATEKDMEKAEAYSNCNLVFDRSDNFLFYATMLGVKVYNLYTRECVREIGKTENPRFQNLALFQGTANQPKAALTVEMQVSDNPLLNSQLTQSDPILFCTAFKKNRFYLFSNREPSEINEEKERDIFNEKPTNEEIASTAEQITYTRTAEKAVLHTSVGDIEMQLFPDKCPKTVENFCVHARNKYYNGHIFHRVIKNFMIQTGDPTGTGTGGDSIWGANFEDEFHKDLRHDKPFTVSMANCGRNTNGSQFFLTVVPTNHLNDKHTVFGRVTKGMDIVLKISKVKTDKYDKPYDEIKIISVSI